MKIKFNLRFYEWLTGFVAVGFAIYLVSGCGQPLCVGGIAVSANGCNFPVYSNTPYYGGGGTGAAAITATPTVSTLQTSGTPVSCQITGGYQPYYCTIQLGTGTCTVSGATATVTVTAGSSGIFRAYITDGYNNYGYCTINTTF